MEEKKKVPSSLKPRLVRCDLPATRTLAEGSRAVRNGLAEADPSLGAHVPPRRASAHGVLATSPRASSPCPRAPRPGGGHLPGGHRHWKRLTLSTHCPLFTQGLLWHSSTSSSQCTPLKPAATDHTRGSGRDTCLPAERAGPRSPLHPGSARTFPQTAKRTRPRWAAAAVRPDGGHSGTAVSLWGRGRPPPKAGWDLACRRRLPPFSDRSRLCFEDSAGPTGPPLRAPKDQLQVEAGRTPGGSGRRRPPQ